MKNTCSKICSFEQFVRIFVSLSTSNKYTNMKLSQLALQKINTTQVRLRLAMQFDCTERWISQLIKENDTDGDLTKASALNIIREQTGLTDEEILETEAATAGK